MKRVHGSLPIKRHSDRGARHPLTELSLTFSVRGHVVKQDIVDRAYPSPIPPLTVRFTALASQVYGESLRAFYISCIHRRKRVRQRTPGSADYHVYEWLVDLRTDVGYGPVAYSRINIDDLVLTGDQHEWPSLAKYIEHLWMIECRRFR